MVLPQQPLVYASLIIGMLVEFPLLPYYGICCCEAGKAGTAEVSVTTQNNIHSKIV